jgi:hypothetical protein
MTARAKCLTAVIRIALPLGAATLRQSRAQSLPEDGPLPVDQSAAITLAGLIASTTSSVDATVDPNYVLGADGRVDLAGFDIGEKAAFAGHADRNHDGKNDYNLVEVDPPLPPPTSIPARYRVLAVNGATGLTLINVNFPSPAS